MEARELRIGNYYEQFGYVHQADWETIKDLSESIDNARWCKPIQLTDEWLLKFGAENNFPIASREYKIEIGGNSILCINHYENGFLFIMNGWDYGIFIKYVHQLQNLIYALTGKELEPKEI